MLSSDLRCALDAPQTPGDGRPPECRRGRSTRLLLLLEEAVELGPRAGDSSAMVLGYTVLEGEERAEIRLLPVRYVLGDMLFALVVRGRIPVLAVLAALQINAAVRAGVRPLELDLEDQLVLALVAEVPLLLDLGHPAHAIPRSRLIHRDEGARRAPG